MRDQFKTWIEQVVRWGDMDAFAHVNNAAYFTYCESARIHYFQEIALDEHKEDAKHGPAVVTATCNFRRQVHHPATLDVGVRASEIGRKSFTLEYVLIRREDDEIVADGSSVVVWVDYAEGKAIPLPEAIKTRIRERDGVE